MMMQSGTYTVLSSDTTSAAGTTIRIDNWPGRGGACYHILGVTCPNCAPIHKSSKCPTCTPRCPHGYPADQVFAPPIVTWGPYTGPYTFGPITIC